MSSRPLVDLAEQPTAETLVERLEAYFRKRAGWWIDGRELARVAGVYGWRTRVSDLRRRGMNIENRQRRGEAADGRRYSVSEYRFAPEQGKGAGL